MYKKSLSLIIIFVLILSVLLIAATKNHDPRLDKKTLSNSRSSNNEAFSIKRIYEGPIYKKSGRQAQVLFVEDPGMSGFGPLIKPDPQWTSWLDQTLGAGNYDWYGPIVDSSDGPSVATMDLYDLVIWNCYDWWWGPPSYAPTAQAIANMKSYMDAGGKVWLIGQDMNISHGGLVPTFLGPYFEVQSLTDDVLWDPYTINCVGAGVLTGFSWTDSSDFQANGFFSDDITPTANGQIITTDATDPYDYNIITNDFRSSFWTIDGRICTPDSVFVAVVDSMLTLFGIGVAVAEKPITQDPKSFSLTANTSNPTKGYTSISYSTTQRGKVSLKVYDGAGRLVRELVDGLLEPAGTKTVSWNGKDENHRPVATGIYFIRLSTENKTATKKMVVVR